MSEHAPSARGRQWAEHIARIQIGARTQHDHRNGWQHCPTCGAHDHSGPLGWETCHECRTRLRQCGEPTCPICATP
jgi:uncharacterized paraquat-inducible protein A